MIFFSFSKIKVLLWHHYQVIHCYEILPCSSFHQVFVVFQAILYWPFSLVRLLQKVIHWQSKLNFFFQLIADRFWLCCFVYVFLRTLFQSSVIIKLQIASYLYTYIASYLASHQIMWHKQKKPWSWFENYKLFLFFWFPRNLSSRMILPP